MKVVLDAGWAGVFLMGAIATIGGIGKLIAMLYKLEKDLSLVIHDHGARITRVEEKVDRLEKRWKPVS